MSEWKKFFRYLGVGTALSVLIAFLRGLATAEGVSGAAHCLSDGFFVTGAWMAGIGALGALAGGTDFFDLFTYGAKSLGVMFTPFRKPENHEKFYEYKQKKAAGRRKPRLEMLYTGCVLMAVAALWLLLV